jgi:hypothetical protein
VCQVQAETLLANHYEFLRTQRAERMRRKRAEAALRGVPEKADLRARVIGPAQPINVVRPSLAVRFPLRSLPVGL